MKKRRRIVYYDTPSFLQGITLAERLYHIGEHILKEHVLLRIGTKLLHGIGYLENNRRFPLG